MMEAMSKPGRGRLESLTSAGNFLHRYKGSSKRTGNSDFPKFSSFFGFLVCKVRSMGIQSPDADDVAREAVMRALSTYDPRRGGFPSYCGVVIRDLVKSYLRGRRLEEEIPDGGEFFNPDVVSGKAPSTGSTGKPLTPGCMKAELDAMSSPHTPGDSLLRFAPEVRVRVESLLR